MSKTLLPLREVKAALKSVKAESYARGVEAGRAEATRMLEFAVRLNGHGPRTLKAIMGGDDEGTSDRGNRIGGGGVGDGSGAVDVGQDAPPRVEELVLLAYMDALAEAKEHHPEGDGGTVAQYLRGLLDEPEQAAAVFAEVNGGDVSVKAFDSSKHPRGDDGRFIGRESIHAAKSDPELAEKLRAKTTDPEERKKLDAALTGESDLGRTKAGLHKERVAATKAEKAERLQKVRTLAEEISMARRGGQEVPPEHFTELAEHLPHLTVDQLRSVRTSLAASFWGRTRRDEMVTALVRHAKVKAEQLRAEQAADDPLDFSLEAMSNTGGTGHADAGRSELNPWREFDKDKNYSEAQHGGRIEQRQKLMAELPASDKTSHGTPDVGSILKQRGKPEEPASKQVAESKPDRDRGAWDESPTEPSTAANQQKPSYTTDKPEGGATVGASAQTAATPASDSPVPQAPPASPPPPVPPVANWVAPREEGKPKEPWEMSQSEYRAEYAAANAPEKLDALRKRGFNGSHREDVIAAMKAGKPVPQHVIDQHAPAVALQSQRKIASDFGDDYESRLKELAGKVADIGSIVATNPDGKLTVSRKQTGPQSFAEYAKGQIVKTPSGPKIIAQAGKPRKAKADGSVWGYVQDIKVREPKPGEMADIERSIAARSALNHGGDPRNQDYPELKKKQMAEYAEYVRAALSGTTSTKSFSTLSWDGLKDELGVLEDAPPG